VEQNYGWGFWRLDGSRKIRLRAGGGSPRNELLTIHGLYSSMQSSSCTARRNQSTSHSPVQSSSCTARCNPSTGPIARCNLQVAQLDAILPRVVQPGAIFKLHSSMQSLYGSTYSLAQFMGRTAWRNLQVVQLDAIQGSFSSVQDRTARCSPRVIKLDAIQGSFSSVQSTGRAARCNLQVAQLDAINPRVLQPGAIFKLHSSMQSIHGSYSPVQSSSCTARCNPCTGRRIAWRNLRVIQLGAIYKLYSSMQSKGRSARCKLVRLDVVNGS